MAILSILGMYDYDQTIFDGLQLPTAADITDEADKVSDPWIPDKQEFVEYLCMECAELELLYPSAPTLSKMVSIWSKARQPVWNALYNTLLYKYNPIWNKDGFYTETRNLSGSDLRTPDLTTLDTGEVINMETAHTGDVKHNVTGYDANTYSPDVQDVNDTKDTTNGRSANTRKETGTDQHKTTDTGTITREESGNIGVTMTQEMIERQRDVVMFNLYDVIVQEFKNRFCLMLY